MTISVRINNRLVSIRYTVFAPYYLGTEVRLKLVFKRSIPPPSIRIYSIELPNTSSNKLQTCVPANETDQCNQNLWGGIENITPSEKKVVYLKFIEYMMPVLIP